MLDAGQPAQRKLDRARLGGTAHAFDRADKRAGLARQAQAIPQSTSQVDDRRAPEIQVRPGRGGFSKSTVARGPFAREEHDDVRLSVAFAVEGLPPDLALMQTGYETTAVVDGRGSRHVRVDTRRPTRRVWWNHPVEAVLPCRDPGFPPPWEPSVSLSGESPFEIFQLDAESSGDPSTPRLSEVRGRLFLSVLRPRVVVRAPARPDIRC